MALFGFGKKKEGCACSGASGTAPAAPSKGGAVHSVKVLGSGCSKCHTLLLNTQEALRNKGIRVEAEYVTDLETIMSYGAMSMPALVVDEKVVSAGKVLKAADVEKLL